MPSQHQVPSLEDLTLEIIARHILQFIISQNHPNEITLHVARLQLNAYIAPLIWRIPILRGILKEIHKLRSSSLLEHCIDIFKFVVGPEFTSLCLIGTPLYCFKCCANLKYRDFAHAFSNAIWKCDCSTCITNMLYVYSDVSNGWPQRMEEVLAYASKYYGRNIKFLHFGEIGESFRKSIQFLPNLTGVSFKLANTTEIISDTFRETITSLATYCTNLSYFSLTCMGFELEGIEELGKLKKLKTLELDTKHGDEDVAAKLICELPNLQSFGWRSQDSECDFERILSKVNKICPHGTCHQKTSKWLAPLPVRKISNTTSHMANFFPINLPIEEPFHFKHEFLYVEGDFGLITQVVFDQTRLQTLLPFFRCNGASITIIHIELEQMRITTDNALCLIGSCPHLQSISFIGCIFPVSAVSSKKLRRTSLKHLSFYPYFLSSANGENKIAMLETIVHSSPSLRTIQIDLGSVRLDDANFSRVFPERLRFLQIFHLEGMDLHLSEASLKRVMSMSNNGMEVGFINLWFGIMYQWSVPPEIRGFLEENRIRVVFKECLSKRRNYIRNTWIEEINELIHQQ